MTIYSISASLSVKYGNGRHFIDIPLKNIPDALQFWWICELLYATSTFIIRVSIAVFLLRIAINPIHKFIIHITLAIVLAFSTFYLFLVTFQCAPVSFFWNQARFGAVKGTCINDRIVPNASIAHSVVSFLADWILGLLPIAVLWDVRMNVQTKVSIIIILSMGLL